VVAVDWGSGSYERQAVHLLPAVQQVVAEIAVEPGEFVVDVGCGSGSAVLLVAAGGARVVEVDPAPRLLEVARTEAARRGVAAEFVVGDAVHIPLADGTVDAVVSTFALIFVPDPAAAVQEIARVLRPGGRLVFSA
jgi:ubiquinone/menaquinone biosynthesis C-methylase UbiE